MRKSIKLLSLLTVLLLVFSMSSCRKKESAEPSKKESMSEVSGGKEKNSKNKKTENKENTENADENKTEEVNAENVTASSAVTDEQAATQAFTAYVEAAKKLDFNTMNKYMADSKSLPILDSYTEAYSKYSVSDKRIKELCRARLGTYKITPVSAVKSGNDVVISAKIMMVNMESLQNKWMETLCNKYPEYTSLSEEQMTPQVVDTLIQTMIDVLKQAEPVSEVQKNFTLSKKGDGWIINAKNDDIFPSN